MLTALIVLVSVLVLDAAWRRVQERRTVAQAEPFVPAIERGVVDHTAVSVGSSNAPSMPTREPNALVAETSVVPTTTTDHDPLAAKARRHAAHLQRRDAIVASQQPEASPEP